MAGVRICSIPDCGKKFLARGLCRLHYMQRRFRGDEMPPIEEKKNLRLEYIDNVALTYEGDECLIWDFPVVVGRRPKITVNGENEIAARYICKKAHGDPPSSEYQAAHSCGKGHLGCLAKRHISWKTVSANMMDKVIHGTDMRGEKHPHSKLTESDILEIREMRGSMPQREIAERYGVSRGAIRDVMIGKNWKFIQVVSSPDLQPER